MGRDEKANMDTLHELESRYQKHANDLLLLAKDEDLRRLRVRMQMLRDDGDFLGDELADSHEANASLTAQCDDLSAQLEAKLEVTRTQESQLRKQEREFNNLRAELQSVNSATQDSAVLLSEKLSLNRELSVLKPEIEHLRSQVDHNQSVLAEKLALERQVNTLEVELANEKKASRRALEKRGDDDRIEEELRKKLRTAEKQLASERAERTRIEDLLLQEKEAHDLTAQQQGEKRTTESELRKKLEEAQTRSRSLKDERDSLEGELESARQNFEKMQNDKADTSAEVELRAQLAEAQSKVQATRKESQKKQQDTQTELSEAEARNDELSKKLEKMRNKLRETTEQLRQCQADLEAAEELRSTVASAPAAKAETKPQQARKKKAQEPSPEELMNITIQTPDGERAHRTKKESKARAAAARQKPTTLTQKSEFSVTPWLNRSAEDLENSAGAADDVLEDSILGGAPQGKDRSEEGEKETNVDAQEEGAASLEPQPSPKAPRGRGKAKKKPLEDAPSARQNANPAAKKAAQAAKGDKSVPAADEPVEPEIESREPSIPAEREKPRPAAKSKPAEKAKQAEPTEKKRPTKVDFSQPPSIFDDDGKKKKRKLGGPAPSLFDDDDGEDAKKPAGGAKRMKKGPLGKVQNAFGAFTFSPLKKERRGVAASFLG